MGGSRSGLTVGDVFAHVGLELAPDFVGFGFKEGSRLSVEGFQVLPGPV